MRVLLTQALEDYVREQVSSGLYADESDVIRDALRRKITDDEREAAVLFRLREALDDADDDQCAGRFDTYRAGYLDNLDSEPAGHAAE